MNSPASISSALNLSPSRRDSVFLSPPEWVAELVREGQLRPGPGGSRFSVRACETDAFCLATICLPWASTLRAEEFEATTAEMYRILEQVLGAGPAPHPVRVWNHLPDIHAPSGRGTDRYMAFNAGRFRAYAEWFGDAAFDRAVPSASAVGHDGAELVIHALGSQTPGVPVANPRQIAPYRYSRRYGPRPPCFARATVLPADAGIPRQVLVGGTASIRGEESFHPGNIAWQLRETSDNLAHLLRAASAVENGADNRAEVNAMTTGESVRWLGQFRDLRVYYVRDEDRSFIEAQTAGAFSPACRIEYVHADLCRSELLVEIEGMARAREE
jgi:hypothetical protein